ncbi:hypothetical protein A3F07_00540 [candidate division WWE3 bacterium RIFCSPHIGHO2_12_FULL_38_15]|uniref:Methyltransferase domain-containing protein n=1 Tax=candidate division WWE3 bacterium RIFCSPHIGHO2_02_FULL_38_14 TaxID=1802620 RepID=A0A1F4VB28_UNCKA|nr:MAG: hypothetical protein A2793_00625 [candidate division WWE3 bacterium RIFCSPHIGHO2_01_FULL_38_45]OGC49062.1 MAG: hypothetical protein A3F07_00540 [candidate division WWE3 bacterium RIFCSPHIGHO2_12_FULL_38_15]OGC53517.1 MAG: hypothetical protein A3B64_04175 [candidate division WWE3 bacterium RIFCSPLOWO2_01_FULL_37_24]OGC54421.1 MAG: hypothetical protein A3D91_00805 [candidate division WWE3 bacterium RIFCSPHIGHO2_02_FULL_38_14]HLB51666.1 hypothetical protein [Patescibacteria group bacterium
MSVIQNLSLPKVIYETDSPYNGHIQVVEAGKTRRVIVDKITQSLNWDSPSAQQRVWGRVVEVLKANEPNLTNILILGLGGGTMQHLISRVYDRLHIVSVDIDPVMVDIAKRYFDLDSIPNHKVIVEDACRFIVEPEKYNYNPNVFNAVVVDIYVGSRYPDLGKSGNFITAVKNLVRPGGLVVFNRIYTNEHQDEVNIFIDTVEMYLTDVKSVIVAGTTNSDNVIIYGRAY